MGVTVALLVSEIPKLRYVLPHGPPFNATITPLIVHPDLSVNVL